MSLGIYILLAILLIGILWWSTKEGAYVLALQPMTLIPSLYSNQLYRFYRGKEFPDQQQTILTRRDLIGNVPALMALCETMPNCAGFSSTSGDMKRHVLSVDYLKPIMAPMRCGEADGIYVKTKAPCYPW